MARRHPITFQPYHGAEPVTPPKTIAELCQMYLQHQSEQLRDGEGNIRRSYLHVRTKIKRFSDVAGHLPPAAIDVSVMREFKLQLSYQPFSHYYAIEHLSVVKRMMRWAAEHKFVPIKVYREVEIVSPPKPHRQDWRKTEVKPVTWEVVHATVQQLHPQVGSMVMIQWLTGMRPGELVQMRVCDIERSQYQKVWIYTPRRHKLQYWGRSRWVVVGPAAQKYLQPFLVKRGHLDYLFSPAEPWNEHHQRLILSATNERTVARPKRVPNEAWRPPGKRYTTTTYARAIARACDRAFPHPILSRIPESRLTHLEIEELRAHQRAHRWSPNQIRHAVATRLRHKLGIEAARTVLGHSSAKVTEIYAERDLETAIAVMEKLG